MSDFKKRVNFLINFDNKKTLSENFDLNEEPTSGEPRQNVYNFKPKQNLSIQDKTYVKEPINVQILRTKGFEYLKQWLEQANSDELSTYTSYLQPQPPKQTESTITQSGVDVTKQNNIKWSLPYDSNRAQMSICLGTGVKLSSQNICNCGESNKFSDYIYKDDEAGLDYGKWVKKQALNKPIDYWTKDEKTKNLADPTKSNLETTIGGKIGTPNCMGKDGYEFLNEIYKQDLHDWNTNYKFYDDLQSLILITSIITAIFTGGLAGLALGGAIDLTAAKMKYEQSKGQSNPYLKMEQELEAGILLAWALLPGGFWVAGGLSKTIVGGLIKKIISGVLLNPTDRLLRLKILKLLRNADRQIFLNFTKNRVTYFLNKPGKLGILNSLILLKLSVKSWKYGIVLSSIGLGFVTIEQLGNWFGVNLFGANPDDLGPLKKFPRTKENEEKITKAIEDTNYHKETKEKIIGDVKIWDNDRLKTFNERMDKIMDVKLPKLNNNDTTGVNNNDTTYEKLDVDLSDIYKLD